MWKRYWYHGVLLWESLQDLPLLHRIEWPPKQVTSHHIRLPCQRTHLQLPLELIHLVLKLLETDILWESEGLGKEVTPPQRVGAIALKEGLWYTREGSVVVSIDDHRSSRVRSFSHLNFELKLLSVIL